MITDIIIIIIIGVEIVTYYKTLMNIFCVWKQNDYEKGLLRWALVRRGVSTLQIALFIVIFC